MEKLSTFDLRQMENDIGDLMSLYHEIYIHELNREIHDSSQVKKL